MVGLREFLLLLACASLIPHCSRSALTAAAAAAAEDGSSSSAFRFVGGFLGLDKERESASRSSDKAAGLQVIGAGFSRTGTKSTEAALIRLGHKIYDTRRWDGDVCVIFVCSLNPDRTPLTSTLYLLYGGDEGLLDTHTPTHTRARTHTHTHVRARAHTPTPTHPHTHTA